MGKRFTETNKWDDPWYRKLPSKYKIFWQYLLDKCDNAGVWIKDFEAFEFFSAEKAEESEALRFINEGKERVQILNTGSRWLVVDFVAFQFGKLNEDSRVHRSVLALQTKMVEKGYLKGIQTLKDKDKDKDKDKEKLLGWFEDCWHLYPNKLGKKEAERHFLASVQTEQDLAEIKKAIHNYQQSKEFKGGYIKHGSTFFNQWRDWVNYVEPGENSNVPENLRQFMKKGEK